MMLSAFLQSFAEMGSRKLDPFALVAEELESVSERLRRTILTEIPVLSSAAEYFFKVLDSCLAAGCNGLSARPTAAMLVRDDAFAVQLRPAELSTECRG